MKPSLLTIAFLFCLSMGHSQSHPKKTEGYKKHNAEVFRLQKDAFTYSTKLDDHLEAYEYLQKTNAEIINYLKDSSLHEYPPLVEVLYQTQAYMTESYVYFLLDGYTDILVNAKELPESYFYLDPTKTSGKSEEDIEKIINVIQNDKKSIASFIDSTISLYDKAIKECDDCAYYNFTGRMNFMELLNDDILFNMEMNADDNTNEKPTVALSEKQKDYYYSDWETLKSMGAKPRYMGIVLTPEYHFGKYSGYGGEISIKDVFEPLQFIRYKAERTKIVLAEFASFGTLGFEYYPENKQSVYKASFADFGFSFFRGNLLQLFYTTMPGQKALGYRPELGLGFGPLTVTYGINIHFKKNFENFNRHLLNIKLNIPIYKEKWKYKLEEFSTDKQP